MLRTLLTTDKFFVAHSGNNETVQKNYDSFIKTNQDGKFKRAIDGARAKGLTPFPGNVANYDAVKLYGLPYGSTRNSPQLWDYPLQQPIVLPHRKGVLTHPAWLWAHSTNFDNDPIHRGIWIYRKLLAGIIPDVPPDVDAKVPEDPHRTLRERLDVVRADACWKCHRKINPLGETFEIFDDFGRHRKLVYFDKNKQVFARRDKVFESARKSGELTTRPIDSTGKLDATFDAKLDGPVTDAFDLIDRLAQSDKVRQSFVRHTFRYFMGRNETLIDSRTLIEADRVYVESGGSFKVLITSLLTSDSFIYRK